MNKKILLTSFQTWLPDQVSNSSDDLLGKIAQTNDLSASLTFLRQLPVDIAEASAQVIATIDQIQPDGIICCGMASKRHKLTVESCATREDACLQTPVNLEQLIAALSGCEISHDAGKFVCEGLYYEVLKYLGEHHLNTSCIFVHVPVLNPENLPGILADFRIILEQMAQ
ncbi:MULTISPECIES: pyrrolidone-carboxylate peptidase [Moorena]|uniref:Pyrrolidone-carboxylate peptidase family protein n=1 Tax=Moorena producens 3L TaxID=489825 RepID=F4Y122_9CYAN|nr:MULTISPECIES: pyrrolidone-carboxylate peptidase [Moorena]EGJ29533.1 pyrrolidone-carboxylate peptidase family protein [Moorena producens 3L]NEP35028.1 peptidase C15 [Moorena sp. SIO3B2]NEP67212.1 peptidase C15 [Moorena sp. SIO3A5]NEQ08985.1 peptidase C15 [Moorena sp. SIO4E2]NER91392.1 peptidase C15 [Moorena sp. SIO3A2]